MGKRSHAEARRARRKAGTEPMTWVDVQNNVFGAASVGFSLFVLYIVCRRQRPYGTGGGVR